MRPNSRELGSIINKYWLELITNLNMITEGLIIVTQ